MGTLPINIAHGGGSQNPPGVAGVPPIGVPPISTPGLTQNPNPLVPGSTIAPIPTTNPLAPASGAAPITGATVPAVATAPVTTAPPVSLSPALTPGTVPGGQSNSLLGDFQATYGQGTGTALEGVLANLGTATSTAVSATNAETQQQAEIQAANIKSNEAAAGVSANSSTAALAMGDFESQVNIGEQSTDAQMELSEENTLIQALQNEGGAHGPDSSTLGTIGSVLGEGVDALGSVAGAVSEGFGVGGTAGTILDTLSEL